MEELEFCMICGERNPVDKKICECGSTSFIFGKNFKYSDEKAVCGCGCDTFRFRVHKNFGSIHESVYSCVKCDNTISTQSKTEFVFSEKVI